jgi:biopolymer transport protein TolQ
MAAADPALTAESFSALALFLKADWVVKGVMIGLALASLWSWMIILDKLFRFAALNRQADRFEDQVGSGRSLEEVAAQAGEHPRDALPRMLVVALREWRETRGQGPLGETGGALMMQRIDRGLDGLIARESQRVENGLGSLAIVATASPFVGLFGTVWGIMNAFQAIAVQRSTNLTVVAPAIAEALFATAIGLIAAIPAYIAYNKFSTDAARFSGRLEGFADDLTAAMARRLATSATTAQQGGA